MAKFIYRGFNSKGDLISSQPFAITGANLRKSQKKTVKPQARTKLQEPQKEEGN